MEKNHLNFSGWSRTLDEGNNKCFLMYDNCIVKILKEYGIEISTPNSFLFKITSKPFF